MRDDGGAPVWNDYDLHAVVQFAVMGACFRERGVGLQKGRGSQHDKGTDGNEVKFNKRQSAKYTFKAAYRLHRNLVVGLSLEAGLFAPLTAYRLADGIRSDGLPQIHYRPIERMLMPACSAPEVKGDFDISPCCHPRRNPACK
jgi:hypothetical protein